jgi:ubiquitin-protein ligase
MVLDSVVSVPSADAKHTAERRPKASPDLFDPSALKTVLDSLPRPSSSTAAEIKESMLYRRAELLLVAGAQIPSFTSFLVSDIFFAPFLDPSAKEKPSLPSSPVSLLGSIMAIFKRYTTALSVQQAWEFFEKGCFESTLNVLSTLESIPCKGLPDVLEEEVTRWEETLKNEARPSAGSFWASGTGYGTDYDSDSWTRSSSLRSKEEKDRVVASLLATIANFLLVVSSAPEPRVASVIKMVQSSALLPYLSTTLSGLFEAEAEPTLQQAIVDLVSSLARPPFFDSILTQPSFLPKIRELDMIAGRVLVGSTKFAESEDDGEVALALSLREVFSFFRHDSVFLLRNFTSTANVEENNSRDVKDNKEAEKKDEKDEKKEKEQEIPTLSYEETFRKRDLIFGESDDILSLPKFKYKEKAAESATFSKSGMKRLLKEQASFTSVLPVHSSSSVFVRVDSSRPEVLQALITGPEGTPYQNGCFLFDIFCKNYPQSAPLVNLSTTGNGAVRFNPNLYNCGKVCLSLLGTWDGASGETWDSKMSTLLQLFVSIQSLIFVDEPYYNEPGYEEDMGSEWSQKESEQYSENIRKQTLVWAVKDVIENPPQGFEEVVRLHFKMKKEEVLAQANKWMEGKDTKVAESVEAALNSL